VGQGASSKEVATAAAPSPLPGSTPVRRRPSRRVARDPRRVAALEGASAHASQPHPFRRPPCLPGPARQWCGGETNESTAENQATSTTAAPTTTAPPPLTAKERAWLKAIPRVSGKIEKAMGASTINVTPVTMHTYANTLRSCRRELLGAGSRSDRLQPVYALVKRACAQYDKGAGCFDKAATLNPIGPGTPAARAQDQAIECGLDQAVKGLSLLADAENEGSKIQAAAGPLRISCSGSWSGGSRSRRRADPTRRLAEPAGPG
jgi:hypothetical protein